MYNIMYQYICIRRLFLSWIQNLSNETFVSVEVFNFAKRSVNQIVETSAICLNKRFIILICYHFVKNYFFYYLGIPKLFHFSQNFKKTKTNKNVYLIHMKVFFNNIVLITFFLSFLFSSMRFTLKKTHLRYFQSFGNYKYAI